MKITWMLLALVLGGRASADLIGQPYDRQDPETFVGPQFVKKSTVTGPDGKIIGVPEDQLVLQPEEVRTWSYVYLYKDGKQVNEFISIDIRQKKDTGEIFKKICNHFVNPVPLGTNRFSYTVVDMGKTYDASCNNTTPPLGPRRVIIRWKNVSHHKKIVDQMVWSNFIAGASANMMVYVDFSRSHFDRVINSNITFPSSDDSTDILEMRHATMRR